MDYQDDRIEDSFEDEEELDCPVCRMMDDELGVEEGIPFDELMRRGVALPHPLNVREEEVNGVLWRVIHGLSALRIFLHHTDHLSDGELYETLWRDALRDFTWFSPDDPYSATHIDLIGSGSDDDVALWLRYYADGAERSDWQQSFPDYELPPSEKPLYERAAILPDRMDVFEELPS